MNRMLSTSSGLQSGAAQITSMPSYFMGIDVKSPTTGTSLLIIYDSEDSNTSGKLVLVETEIDAGMASINHEFFAPIVCNRGIYVTVTGTATSYVARYSL